MALRFGTDGVRGVANAELTPELALVLGRAAARVLGGDRVVIGRDPRRSGPMLEAALAAGFASAGGDVELVGHGPDARRGLPVRRAALRGRGDLGLPQPLRRQRHQALRTRRAQAARRRRGGHRGRDRAGAGRRGREPAAGHRASARSGRRTTPPAPTPTTSSGCSRRRARSPASTSPSTAPTARRARWPRRCSTAWGRASSCGPRPRMVATSTTGAAQPIPTRSPMPSRPAGSSWGWPSMATATGLIAVDHTGAVVDGDHIIAICALDLHRRGLLRHGTVVVTVMTNLGFRLAMEQAGIHVVETAVGDRYVLEALEAGGFTMGGEQSGHVVFTDLATTGDGILTGLVLADVVQRSGRTLAELAAEAMTRLPQVLINVRVPGSAVDAAASLAPRGGRGRGRARGHGSGAGPAERHRADRAGDGRGGQPRRGRAGRPGPGRRPGGPGPPLASRPMCGIVAILTRPGSRPTPSAEELLGALDAAVHASTSAGSPRGRARPDGGRGRGGRRPAAGRARRAGPRRPAVAGRPPSKPGSTSSTRSCRRGGPSRGRRRRRARHRADQRRARPRQGRAVGAAPGPPAHRGRRLGVGRAGGGRCRAGRVPVGPAGPVRHRSPRGSGPGLGRAAPVRVGPRARPRRPGAGQPAGPPQRGPALPLGCGPGGRRRALVRLQGRRRDR